MDRSCPAPDKHDQRVPAAVGDACAACTGWRAAIGMSVAAASQIRPLTMNSILRIVSALPEEPAPSAIPEQEPCQPERSPDFRHFPGVGPTIECPPPDSFCPLPDALA
jgi:hypothetical protein